MGYIFSFLAGDFGGTDTPRRRVRMAGEEAGGMQKSLLRYLHCNPFLPTFTRLFILCLGRWAHTVVCMLSAEDVQELILSFHHVDSRD